MLCHPNPFLHAVDNYHLCGLIIALALALLVKNRRWAILSGIVAGFYYIGYMTACDIMAFDTGMVWRYCIWLALDLCLLCTVYFAWHKQWVAQYQAVGVIMITAVGDLLQVFRFIDRHYFELAYSSGIYTTLAPTLNNLLVLVCLYPLINTLKPPLKKA